MTTTKHPWTHWAIYIYAGTCAATVGTLWALGVDYPKSGWAVILFWLPLFVLYWKDSLKRADADFDYRMSTLKAEVRRSVQAELKKKKKSGNVVDTEAEEFPPLVLHVKPHVVEKENI